MLHLSVVVFVLALLICSISHYNNCRCVSAASAPMSPSSRILAVMSGDKRCHVRPTRAAACDDDVAADGDVSAGQSSVTQIIDSIAHKVVSIRGGKVEL